VAGGGHECRGRARLSLPIAAGATVAASPNLYTGVCTGWPEQAQSTAEALATYTGDAITLSSRLTAPDPDPEHQGPPSATLTTIFPGG
jgi:hypothetical protein